MKQYLELLNDVYKNGQATDDRTGVGTISVFGRQTRYNLQEGFPAVTTKKLYTKSIIHELLWFIAGDNNLQYLAKNDVNIWNEWPYRHYIQETTKKEVTKEQTQTSEWKSGMKEFVQKIATDDDFSKKWGSLGPIYGYQWRNWRNARGEITDQLKNAIHQIKTNPNSRRIIVNAWNAGEIKDMETSGLPPCHVLFQFNVRQRKYLDCQLYQRSADIFLGVPFNIASYALLTHMVAHETGLEVGEFIHTLGDAHIYKNHLKQVKEQLSRKSYPLPKLWLNPDVKSVFDFTYNDIKLLDYKSHPPIKAPIAV